MVITSLRELCKNSLNLVTTTIISIKKFTSVNLVSHTVTADPHTRISLKTSYHILFLCLPPPLKTESNYSLTDKQQTLFFNQQNSVRNNNKWECLTCKEQKSPRCWFVCNCVSGWLAIAANVLSEWYICMRQGNYIYWLHRTNINLYVMWKKDTAKECLE